MSTSKTITRTDLTNILNEVLPPTPTTSTKITDLTITKTSGDSTCTVLDATRYGNVVTFIIELAATASVSSGTNIFVGTINAKYKPIVQGFGIGYNGSAIQIAAISTGGEITVRNAGSSVASGNKPWVRCMMILPDSFMPVVALQTDYIVEQGTSDIWTYRKWNSGAVECWGRWTETLTNYATYNNMNSYSGSIKTLPFSIYDAVPTYSAKISNGYVFGCSLLHAYTNPLTEVGFYASASASGSQEILWVCDIKGRWK